jgi:hypothetical protein
MGKYMDIKILGGLRMSSDSTDITEISDTTDSGTTEVDSGNSSLFTNLVNKVKYTIFKATYDPNANDFAEKKIQIDEDKKEEKKKEKEEEKETSETTDINEDPTKFSAKRVAKNVIKKIINYFLLILIPFIALMISMIVVNEMIVFTVPIRIIFFIFTFLLVYFYPIATILLPIFYVFKGGYSYYINNMTDGPKRTIMPNIYALLPITTYKPVSNFATILLYPFTYPKTPKGEQTLPNETKEYMKSLVSSFKDYDTVKNLPNFVKYIKKAQDSLIHLNQPAIIKQTNVSNSVKGGEPVKAPEPIKVPEPVKAPEPIKVPDLVEVEDI